jgi:hypothetical protein
MNLNIPLNTAQVSTLPSSSSVGLISRSILSLMALAAAGGVQAALLASYDFDGDLSDTLGSGPDLVDLGGTISGGRYSFGPDQGLKLTSGLPNNAVYAIEMKLQVNENLRSWKKLIDFKELSVDTGLYTFDDGINFYNVNTAGTVVLDTDFTVGVARDNAGMVEVFLDGSSLFSFDDSASELAVSSNDILYFFVDDLAVTGETLTGSVDFIRIHDDASTFGTTPGARVPESGSTLVILALGLLGCVGGQRWFSRRG